MTSAEPAVADPRDAPAPDWPALSADALALLQSLIRVDTTNPPGNELAAARVLAAALQHPRIETRLHEPAAGRAHLVARLRGDGSRRPLLLLGHLDVVAARAEEWTVPPFGGEVRDGRVYGRGAIDDKGMLAVHAVTLRALADRAEAGAIASRDVVLVATCDEETGGPWGLGWLLDADRSLAEAEAAINEGGRVRVLGGRPRYAAVQCAEKVQHVVRVVARGASGHASVPSDDAAVPRLARAIAAIAAWRAPLRITPSARAFFGALAAAWPDASAARAMRAVSGRDARRALRAARALARVPTFNAVLRATATPTVVAGGDAPNSMPAEATALLDVRTLPGQPLEGVLTRLRHAVDDARVTLEVVQRGDDAPASPFDAPAFDAIAAAARALVPSLPVVPALSTGATDAAVLRRAGVATYGILPFPLDEHDEGRMHAADERLPLDALAFGLRLVYEAARRIAG